MWTRTGSDFAQALTTLAFLTSSLQVIINFF